jgi:hypothetical protein
MCEVCIASSVAWGCNFIIVKCGCNIGQFLSAFAKLPKAIVSFVIVCPSVHMGQIGSHWTDFDDIQYLSIFRTSEEKIRV